MPTPPPGINTVNYLNKLTKPGNKSWDQMSWAEKLAALAQVQMPQAEGKDYVMGSTDDPNSLSGGMTRMASQAMPWTAQQTGQPEFYQSSEYQDYQSLPGLAKMGRAVQMGPHMAGGIGAPLERLAAQGIAKKGSELGSAFQAGRQSQRAQTPGSMPEGSISGVPAEIAGGSDSSRWLRNPMPMDAKGVPQPIKVTPEMVAQAKAGDPTALAQVVDGLQNMIAKQAYRLRKLGQSTAEVDDLIAIGNESVVRVIQNPKINPEAFLPYVNKVIESRMLNATRNAGRSMRGATPIDNEIGIADPSANIPEVPRSILNENLNKAMEKLTAKEREAVTIRLGLGEREPMSIEQMVEISGIARQNVHKLINKGMAKIGKELKALGIEPSDLVPEKGTPPPPRIGGKVEGEIPPIAGGSDAELPAGSMPYPNKDWLEQYARLQGTGGGSYQGPLRKASGLTGMLQHELPTPEGIGIEYLATPKPGQRMSQKLEQNLWEALGHEMPTDRKFLRQGLKEDVDWEANRYGGAPNQFRKELRERTVNDPASQEWLGMYPQVFKEQALERYGKSSRLEPGRGHAAPGGETKPPPPISGGSDAGFPGIPANPKAEIEKLGFRYDGETPGLNPGDPPMHWYTYPLANGEMTTGLAANAEDWSGLLSKHGLPPISGGSGPARQSPDEILDQTVGRLRQPNIPEPDPNIVRQLENSRQGAGPDFGRHIRTREGYHSYDYPDNPIDADGIPQDFPEGTLTINDRPLMSIKGEAYDPGYWNRIAKRISGGSDAEQQSPLGEELDSLKKRFEQGGGSIPPAYRRGAIPPEEEQYYEPGSPLSGLLGANAADEADLARNTPSPDLSWVTSINPEDLKTNPGALREYIRQLMDRYPESLENY